MILLEWLSFWQVKMLAGSLEYACLWMVDTLPVRSNATALMCEYIFTFSSANHYVRTLGKTPLIKLKVLVV